ncbi:P-loop containing nucleoside triphosphate hydrolase protein [Phlyctochytrium arcticum]|nr:P-loop containing nucleoside triphosphate hydrolase protein [Phlyctochytrium arcticum]
MRQNKATLDKEVSAMQAVASPTPQRVLVAVRVRPPVIDRKSPQKFDKALGYDPSTSCLTYTNSNVTIGWPQDLVKAQSPAGGAAKTIPKDFNFDSVLGYEEGQPAVYDKIVEPLIRKCLEGYNGCVFCYGQTASGKTYTMEGPKKGPNLEPPFDPADKDTGIILRVASQITNHITAMQKSKPELEYFVKVSYLEIYQENLTDLLVRRDEQGELRIRQDPESSTGRDLYISGITERSITSIQDYVKLLQIGGRHRTTGETNMNEVSSRSHAVMTITIEERRKPADGMSTEEAEMLAKHGRKRSKIHLIDLAGSERANATGATGDRLKEGSAINQSLSSLGNVINALTTKTKHVPYRDSKLTYLLSDSLGGNSLTLMITCVTPTVSNFDESVSTLRFAERVKKVRNAAKVNVDATMMRIMQLEAEIRELRQLLANCKCGVGGKKMRTFGQDASTMAAGSPGRDAATSTFRLVPWYRRLWRCCPCTSPTPAKGMPVGKGGKSKVAPADIARSAPLEEGDETVLRSVRGKLTFV